MSESNSIYDVTILGGGLSGLTLARQLLDNIPGLRLLILEKTPHPVDESAFKVGESTVEIGAHYLAEVVGLKKHLTEDHLPKFGLRFFFNHERETIEHGIEVGASEFFAAPGYQVDRGRLENYLAENVAERGAEFVTARIKQVELAEDGQPHEVTYQSDDDTHTVQTRWVVDASGRAAILKRQLDLKEEISHDVNAAWFRIAAEIHVDQWCDDPDWRARVGKVPRRWLSTNHMLGRGYWVWIIPLATGSTSIGIVADPRIHPLSEFNSQQAMFDWFEKHEPNLACALDPHRDCVQDFNAMKHLGYGCREVFSANRWAITGEAGVFLDPLYSPGIDYIAMANIMITSLIQQDRAGQSIEHNAPRLQTIFLGLFRDNLQTYQDQYPLFGNARVMSLKYVWDYAFYWGFPALLYFNGKMSDPTCFAKLQGEIEVLRRLNRKMQKFLRDWDAVDAGEHIDSGYVDQRGIDLLTQLNAELRDRLDDDALIMRFRRNVNILNDLASEIVSRVQQVHAKIHWDEQTASTSPPRLDGVFAALNF